MWLSTARAFLGSPDFPVALLGGRRFSAAVLLSRGDAGHEVRTGLWAGGGHSTNTRPFRTSRPVPKPCPRFSLHACHSWGPSPWQPHSALPSGVPETEMVARREAMGSGIMRHVAPWLRGPLPGSHLSTCSGLLPTSTAPCRDLSVPGASPSTRHPVLRSGAPLDLPSVSHHAPQTGP